MLIDIPQLIDTYNKLVTSTKFHNIPEDRAIQLYKALIKRTSALHATDNYILNNSMIAEFLRNNSHNLSLKYIQIAYNITPRQLSHLQLYQPTSKDSEVGTYTIVNDIGRGQYGKVFLATDVNHKLVAIKQLDLRSHISSPNIIKHEIDTLKKLSNITPQIAPKFIEAFIQNDHVNIVQEYINCGTLHEYTKTHKFTPKMKKKVKDLISNLHKHNIYHKDLHSENILVKCDTKTKEPTFLIADFGHAKSLENIQKEDYQFIKELRNNNSSIDSQLDSIPIDSMVFDLIIDDIIMSKTTPSLVSP